MTPEKRYSSPARACSPRPQAFRKRSNSCPLVEALGCSTPEAELILAEGDAALRRRNGRNQPRGRRNWMENDEAITFRPRDHMKYLDEAYRPTGNTLHTRTPSNLTDRSTSTVTGPIAMPPFPQSPKSPVSPIGDYSANLSKFIQTQLQSIPTYHQPVVFPRSCPDLNNQARTPPQSPTRLDRRPADMPRIVEIPAIRPPMRSAFSAWSSTDDENDDAEDEVPPLPDMDHGEKWNKTNNSTPSLFRYYEQSGEASFLFSSTPVEQQEHPNAASFAFPNSSDPPAELSEPTTPFSQGDDYPSSHPQLTSSSAPSFSSASTSSYFDFKQPLVIAPQVRDRIIAAVSPHPYKGRVLTATSPFEGGALANVHDILVESQKRVLVDGLSFDLVRDLNMHDEGPRAAPRVPTPC